MTNVSIEIRGINELRAKLKRMDESLTDELVKAVRDSGKLVEIEAKRYPAPSRRKMTFVSEKQRRYVMMLVRRGLVPYRRTHRLETSFNTTISVTGNDVVGTIGSGTVYAPWVKGHKAAGGAGPQARYHSGTWKTLIQDLKAKRGEIRAIFKAAVKRWLNR